MSDVDTNSWGLGDHTIATLLAQRAALDGSWPFARIGGRTVTIAALADGVNRAAAGLAACGIRRGDRVALMLANHMDHVAVFFGVIALGACIIPVNCNYAARGCALS